MSGEIVMPLGPCWVAFAADPSDLLYLHVHGYQNGFVALQWAEKEPWPNYWRDEEGARPVPDFLMNQIGENLHTDVPAWFSLGMIASIKECK